MRSSTRPRTLSLPTAWLTIALLVGALAGCSWFGGANDDVKKSISVFDVKPGQCFAAPGKVKAELSSLSRVACTQAHTQESYAVVAYSGASAAASAGASGSPAAGAYPGSDVLDKFAKGVCAQRFTAYVGIDYLESTLFFTYLLPSARSWQQDDDRNVLCFVTTTGGTLKTSVKGTRK